MKDSMQQMTIEDLFGHWKTKDGIAHIWINRGNKHFQLFEGGQLVIDEPLDYHYMQLENMWSLSESVILFMIFPQENSIILKFGDKKLEFIK